MAWPVAGLVSSSVPVERCPVRLCSSTLPSWPRSAYQVVVKSGDKMTFHATSVPPTNFDELTANAMEVYKRVMTRLERGPNNIRSLYIKTTMVLGEGGGDGVIPVMSPSATPSPTLSPSSTPVTPLLSSTSTAFPPIR